MLVRVNVNVLGYEPEDEVDFPTEWADRLVKGDYATKITKKESDPEAVKPAPEDLDPPK